MAIADVELYGVDVPVGDQWSLSPMFERLDLGSRAPHGLFGQANESRPAVPRLFFIALSRLGRWNVKREMYATQALLIVTSLGLALLSRRLGARWTESIAVLVFANMALFSAAQYSNFLWGIQFIVYVPFACLVWLAFVASGPSADSATFLAAAALCAVATFSFANGMILWPAAAVVLVASRGATRRNAVAWLGWAAAGLGSLAFYVRGYQHPAGHPGFSAAVHAPLDAILGFLAFLGSSLTVDGRFVVRPFPLAVLAGVVICAVLLGILALTMREWRRPSFVRPAAVWLGLAAYGLASAAITVAGRLGFGREYVLSSRYVAFSATTIGATAFLVGTAWRHLRDEGRREGALFVSHAAVALAAAFTVLWGMNSWQCSAHLNEWRRTRLQARALLPFADIADANDVRTVLTPPVPAELHALWSRLVALGVLENLRPRYVAPDAPRATSAYGEVERLDRLDGREYEAAGWSYLPVAMRAGDAVLVTTGSRNGRWPLAACVPRLVRSDVFARTGAPQAIISGWSVRFHVLAPDQEVELWTLDGATDRAYPISRLPGLSQLP
jgi:hypothetical protein